MVRVRSNPNPNVTWAVVEAAGMRAEDEDVTAILLVEVDLEHLALRTLPPLLLQVRARVRVRARARVRVTLTLTLTRSSS